MVINKDFLGNLFELAVANPRLRMNFDMRTSENDGSQRMLNAMISGTEVAIHRHTQSSENIICLCGRMDVILFKEDKVRVDVPEGLERGMDAQDVICRNVLVEAERLHLCPADANYGCVVPKGVWHTVEVFDPSVIYEAKDGKYGEDGSEVFNGSIASIPQEVKPESFSNCLGDLKKNIEYLIGNERNSGNTEVITPEYVSRVLNEPLEDVEKAMKELNV